MSLPEVIDLNAVSQWMDYKSLGSGPLENAHLLTGGTQNYLLQYRRDGRDYLLRRPPQHLRANSNNTMLREARVLKALAGTGVPHPGFIEVCDDEAIIGACFYLMQPISGFNAREELPESHQNADAKYQMGLSMVDGIAALAAVDHLAIGLGDFGKPEGFLDRQAPRWSQQLQGYEQFDGWTGLQALPGVEIIPDWLEANKPKTFVPGIMHGDFHLGNVLFSRDSPTLAAIVDWELCTIGDPLLDLGWLMAMWGDPFGQTAEQQIFWQGFPDTAAIIAHYRAQSSRPIAALDWYHVLACYKLGAILEGTWARACVGKAPKQTGLVLHQHCVNLFNRALSVINGNLSYA